MGERAIPSDKPTAAPSFAYSSVAGFCAVLGAALPSDKDDPLGQFEAYYNQYMAPAAAFSANAIAMQSGVRLV